MNIDFSIPGYVIKRELGRGGMAVVYLAIQESFGRDVAIKVLPLINANDESFTERFLREAKIVSRLVHPNIVTVYDVGIHQGHHYLSMEFIPGMDLRQAQRKLSRLELVNAVKSVASALDYAGKKGYVHRDVKPENIMIHEEDKRVILMDFGIARGNDATMNMTVTGRAIGTPYYMSPEQTKGQQVDHRSDIYSLGIVLYQMLTGRVPYDADSAVAVGIKHITEPIPVLPQNLRMYQTIINTALAKSPQHRYQTAGELIEALDTIPDSALKMLDEQAEDFRMAGLDHGASTIASTDEAALGNFTSGLDDLSQTPMPAQFSNNQTAVTRHSLTGLKPPKERKRRKLLIYALLAILVAVGVYKREALTRFFQKQKSAISALLNKETQPRPATETVPQKAEPEIVKVEPPVTPPPVAETVSAPEVNTEMNQRITRLLDGLEQNSENAIELASLYKQILRQKPSDPDAREGIKHLREWYTREIKSALDSGDLKTARRRVNMLKQSFPRMSRSPRYIKLDKRLKREEAFLTHLQLAKKYIAFKQFSAPADANAMSELIAANNIHPGDKEVIKLREELADHLYAEANEHLKMGRKQKARQRVRTGLLAKADHKELLALQKSLEVKKLPLKEIKQRLAIARTFYNDEQFFTPAGRNAYDAYRNVLKLDPSNKEAKQGLENIKRFWLEIFYDDIKLGNLEEASSSLVKIQERYARDPDIKRAQNRLARAFASSQPEVSMLRLGTQKLYSLRTPEATSLQAQKPLYLGFQYNNFSEVGEAFTLKLVRADNKKQIYEAEINVSGNDGEKFLLLDIDSKQLVAGKYQLQLKIGNKTVARKAFSLQ